MNSFRPEDPFKGHLHAAVGYADLGMCKEARRELRLIEGKLRRSVAALVVDMKISHAAGSWRQMEAAAARLCKLRPEVALWPLARADAVRHGGFPEVARGILFQAVERFPDEAMIYYSLGCIEAHLGRLPVARKYLRMAFRLRRSLRARARLDPDLASLH